MLLRHRLSVASFSPFVRRISQTISSGLSKTFSGWLRNVPVQGTHLGHLHSPSVVRIFAAPYTGNPGNNAGTSLHRRLRRSGSHAIKRNLEGVILAGSHEYG
jgi:hypothetical protein